MTNLTVDPRFEVDDPALYDFCENAALRMISGAARGLNGCLGRRSGSTPGILTYHRVARRPAHLPEPLHNVTPEVFEDQLAGLLRRGFTAWPLAQLLQYRSTGEEPPPRVFCVTFDDGYDTVYSQAWPVLQQLQVPATVFVNTAYLDSSDPFPFDAWGVRFSRQAPAATFRPLSWQQCHEMIDSGIVSIGAHTHTHEDFRGRPHEFCDDLQACVDFLRGECDLEDVPFAFPFGSPQRGFAGPELVAAAKRTSVVCGLTTDPVLVDMAGDPFRWGRFNAFSWDTCHTLAAKLDGWYSWAPYTKRYVRNLCSRSSTASVAQTGGG